MENSPKNSEVKATHVDTTQAMREMGGRDLEDYKKMLGFDERSLEGKTVLDLGSGSYEKLSRDLKKAGIKTNVVALNPDYVLDKYRRIIRNQSHWEKQSIAGVGQALPFKDETFDVILGLESITFYEDALHEAGNARAWSREVARVLKEGGEARLGEILGLGGESKRRAWGEIIEILEQLGLQAEIEPFYINGEVKARHRLLIRKPNSKV